MKLFYAALIVPLALLTLIGSTSAAAIHPTYSSPIALSADNKLVWSVNPADNSVSVIRTDINKLIKNIKVGLEPQAVALSPNGNFAYVADAAGNDVTVVRIVKSDPKAFQAYVYRYITTGAEPWNIVVAPNGKYVFVANSGQDTITVIDAKTWGIIINVDLRNSICNDPDHNRHFQPRGLAVTQD
ncbi:MAG: YncE family protein, partial [Deltaproteobacteria bacterium]|nr:YncE family protein [Deltaproteobacteria bacterium]